MLEPWNDASLLPPPVHTFKCDGNFDLQQLVYTCNSVTKVLSKQSPLHREAAICSRFVYKFDKKFRNDIGYRNLKKVNTALRKYLALDLLKIVENFACLLPKDGDVYLPTRQMLEFVMLRSLTFSKIMLRICVCAKQGAIFYLDRLKRGESHWMSLMPYALLSRIWSMSMVLLQHSCHWYTNFYPFLEKLQLKGLNLLPQSYSLPNDIKEWLDMDNLEEFGRFEWSQKKRIQFDPLIAEDEDGDLFGNILDFVSKINEGSSKGDEEMKPVTDDIINTEQQLHVSNITADQGEKISRDMFKSFYNNKSTTVINHSAEKVTNKESLLLFITTEEKFRNENSNQSLTSHLSFMQWQALKNSLSALHDSLAKNRKIERKFQKLWKEKCLDCK